MLSASLLSGAMCPRHGTRLPSVLRAARWFRLRLFSCAYADSEPLDRPPLPAPCEGAEAFPGNSSQMAQPAWFQMDLAAAVRRQRGFMGRVLDLPTSTLSPAELTEAVGPYLRYLLRVRHRCSREGRKLGVPSLVVDLLWHTHQQHPLMYAADCQRIVGRLVGHIDHGAPAPEAH